MKASHEDEFEVWMWSPFWLKKTEEKKHDSEMVAEPASSRLGVVLSVLLPQRCRQCC